MEFIKKEKIKLVIIFLATLVFFILGYVLGFKKQEPEETISKKEAETILVQNGGPEIEKPNSSVLPRYVSLNETREETIYIKENNFPKVFNNKKITPRTIQAETYPEYTNTPNQVSDKNTPDRLYITTYGSPGYWKKAKNSTLGPKDLPELQIQTYTRPETGFAYSAGNFQFYPNPLKLPKGNFAYISRYQPPSAMVYVKKKKKFIVLTSNREKTLLRALRNLKF